MQMQPLERSGLGDGVYRHLCEALRSGRLEPGQRLKIRDLAAQLDTSVTPVRDAILRLIQDEGLVQKSPRDVRVPHLSPAQYREIRDIRTRLEGFAARRAAQNADSGHVARLEALVAANEAAIQSRDWSRALEDNQRFHFALTEIAQTPETRHILDRLWLRVGPLIARIYPRGGREMIVHHHTLIAAMRAGDPDAAEAAMAADIGGPSDLVLSELESR